MEFQIGQKVRIKSTSTSPAARYTAGEEMTVKFATPDGSRICVTTSGRGSHWVKGEDLELVKDETAAAR